MQAEFLCTTVLRVASGPGVGVCWPWGCFETLGCLFCWPFWGGLPGPGAGLSLCYFVLSGCFIWVLP